MEETSCEYHETHLPPTDYMSVFNDFVNNRRISICYESKAPGLVGELVFHDHIVCHLSILPKMLGICFCRLGKPDEGNMNRKQFVKIKQMKSRIKMQCIYFEAFSNLDSIKTRHM